MLKFSLHIAARTLLLLKRFALVLTLMMGLLISGVVLSLRYIVLPSVEQYHSDITLSVGNAIGLTVEVEKIEADWHGMNPHLRLSGIRILDKHHRTTLALQRVDVQVSWMTVFSGELRLASIEIDQPDLLVKRNARGEIQISGLQLEDKSSDNNFSNMLLNQSRIVVHDAHISWLDELRNAPMLVFENLDLQVENGWNHHRFSLRAIPPKELSSQLDVRGDLYGKNIDDIGDWHGEIFTEIEYADLTAWKTWLPVPDTFKKGKGALRGWLEVEGGKIKSITSDLALLNVQTRLANDLPPLDIRVLRGRLGWHDLSSGFEISTNRLSLKLLNNFELKPTDLLVRLNNLDDVESSSGEVRANLLELDGLAKLLEFLPVNKNFKTQYENFSPQGKVENLHAKWQAEKGKKSRYQVRGRFAGMSLKRVDKLPGFSGLSGEIDGTEQGGTIFVKSHDLKVDAPQILQEPVVIDTITAQSTWSANTTGFEVKLRNVVVSNSDLIGTAFGSYETLDNSPGKLDLTVHLTRVSVPHAVRYIPLIAVNAETRTWLASSLKEGQSSDFNLRIKGNLNDFPFVDNRKGIFKIHAHASGVALEYAPGWPRIEQATADLLMQGKSLEVSSTSAKTGAISLSKVLVTIPSLLVKTPTLTVRGEAESENSSAIAYVNSSPIQGYLDGFTDDTVATGTGKLNLKLDIPLTDPITVKLDGNYHFNSGDIEFDKTIPTLRKVNGDLHFSESSASTNNITAQILGGPAKVLVESKEEGTINIKVGGRTNFAALNEIHPLPLLSKLSGDPVWNLDIGVKNKLSRFLLTSNLVGLRSELPAPIDKKPEAVSPFRLEMNNLSQTKRNVALQYGTLISANITQFKNDLDLWNIKSGNIHFGAAQKKNDRDGLWLTGTLPPISAEGWGMVVDALKGDDGEKINVAGADLSIQKVTGYGNEINDLHVKASSRNDILTAQLTSKEINGELSWQAENNGWLIARLKNLDLAEAESNADHQNQVYATAETSHAKITDFPSVDVTVERLSYKKRQLGKLELLAKQNDNVYLLDHLRLINPDGVLTVDGKWMLSGRDPRTQVNLKLDISNAGNILARSGYPNSLKNGSGKLEGTLSWPGSPDMVSNKNLSGKLTLDTGKGQFLQIEPGIGKLLSILSLQALPKRITLDFQDVFSKGFEFDNISGTATINQGVIDTNNLKIDGSSAKVFMTGQMDMVNETQNMRVHIVPTVGNSVALITLWLANPVMGAGVFIAGQVFNDPLGQLVSFEYNITGSWVDPKVEKVGGSKSAK